MSADLRRAVPGAIVLGMAFVAIAIYFGLRSRPAEAPSPAGLSASSQTPLIPHVETPRPIGDPALAASRVEATRQASSALERQRAALVAACWKPLAEKTPGPPKVSWIFNFTFDADGHQISRGQLEDRQASRGDVTNCVTSALVSIQIPAPGANTYVEVPFSLP